MDGEVLSPSGKPTREVFLHGLLYKLADELAIRKPFEVNPKLPGFILAGHGIVALGKDILAAEHMAELFEETAQIAITKAICEKLEIY